MFRKFCRNKINKILLLIFSIFFQLFYLYCPMPGIKDSTYYLVHFLLQPYNIMHYSKNCKMQRKGAEDDPNMFLNQKNIYCQNECPTPGSIQIQYNLYKLLVLFFTELEKQQNNNNNKFVWRYKRPQIAKVILKRTELDKSGSLTSDYTTKLQSSKQYDTGIKLEIQINRTG